MPKRNDLKTILVIGAGPIVIGQALEFDYSGAQALKALRDLGYKTILVNSNPATIMTDPEMADRVYIEPLTRSALEAIIEIERPEAILPTVGGQTALNLAIELFEAGVLERFGVELIGAKIDAIRRAEDRALFRETIRSIGLEVPRSAMASNLNEAREAIRSISPPVIIRPAFTLGGTGGSIARDEREFLEKAAAGLAASPSSQILIEESIAGWKEFELELMRDANDNCVIICSIENLDPMGIHTGDSITVAPAQTLSDREYQAMRDAAFAIIRAIGVETGGSNIQFALNPENGKMVVIEMNPRVSRSSALASKATGFPIAKIAAKLAVGMTLDEIPNDITKKTPASFEPALDYIAVKMPRFTFEKFPKADPLLGAQMKSVGEAMALGSTFTEALQKGARSLEIGASGLDLEFDMSDQELIESIRLPTHDRIWRIAQFFRRNGCRRDQIETIFDLTAIDRWFLSAIARIVQIESTIEASRLDDPDFLRDLKRDGFSDQRIARLSGESEDEIRRRRIEFNIRPRYRRVDTCAGEFEAIAPYMYSTYDAIDYPTSTRPDRADHGSRKIVILGGGPNRIGQGIEFDYCCVHAVIGARLAGCSTVMINCNPETVSTDYDSSDRLYFEPLTFEDVIEIIERERPDGVMVQFGGQTPLNLAARLKAAGAPIIGTDPDAIERAEDRDRFKRTVDKLQLRQPPSAIARSIESARRIADRIGYPIIARPSFVLGGRAMEIILDPADLDRYTQNAFNVAPDRAILIDKFLDGAIEFDVDAVADGRECVIGAIMEHIEAAGVHSGDSASVLPALSVDAGRLDQIRDWTKRIALELNTIGLLNIQFALKGDQLYLLEVNPRASRTAPFVSKAIGAPLAQIAAQVMIGRTLREIGFDKEISVDHVAVKESVFPFNKFPNVDTLLGPEMKSTGEVMGIARSFGTAFYKATLAAGYSLPLTGSVFISVTDEDKPEAVRIGAILKKIGFDIFATKGTAVALKEGGVRAESILKAIEGLPNCVDYIERGEIDMVINTTSGADSIRDSYTIRRMALNKNVAYQTTIAGARAATRAIEAAIEAAIGARVDVAPIGDYH